MPPSFETLPVEILHNVGDILASEHLPSLHAFSLVSKFCCTIANTYRFQNIHFSTAAERRFLTDIQHWERVLERTNAFSYVRRLSVDGQVPSPKYNSNAGGWGDPDMPHRYQGSFPAEDEWTSMSCQYPYFLYCRPGSMVNGVYQREDMDAWRPLSGFLRKLSGLRDLFWLTNAQFPPCLLDVLHHDLPTCRLHLRAFRFHSLYNGGSTRHRDIDAYEYTLATSPSLASIACIMLPYLDASAYKENAVMQMAGGLAPNLSQVDIVYHQQGRLPPDESKLPQRSLFLHRPKAPSARLKSLSLYDPGVDCVEAWSNHVSFPDIEVLQVEIVYTITVLAKLSECRFASLRTLALRLAIMAPAVLGYERTIPLDNNASIFLSSLPPLKSLFIESYYAAESIKAALKHHGQTLRKLGLKFINSEEVVWRSRMNPDLIDDVRTHCPNLRELTVRIPRSKGDAREVNLYQSLGKILHLKHLTIELDCSGFWRQIERGGGPDPKDVLINIAVDEPLIRAIWAIITADPSSSLQSLRVTVKSDHKPLDLGRFAQLMGSTWEAYRFPDRVWVHKWDSRRKRRDKLEERKETDGLSRSQYRAQFRELWPARGESWLDDWRSFPLYGQD